MALMAKPFVAQNLNRTKLKNGETKKYYSYSLRISVYDRETRSVRQEYLRAIGAEPTLTLEEANELVNEFGKQYGFTLDDLYDVRRLEIISDREEQTVGGERDS